MSLRRSLFYAHLTVGVIVGVVIFIIASTGMIMAFRPQIIAFAERGTRIESPIGSRVGIQALLDKAGSGNPDIKPMSITISADPHAPVAVNAGEGRVIFLNPYTGDVIGNGSSIRQWMENVEYWHRWLGLGGGLKVFGGNIKRACNVAFIFMILTGIYLWWPRQWMGGVLQALTRLNFKLKGHARNWNWHTAIGFWCAPFLLVIALTGLIMSYPWANNLLYRMTGNPPGMSHEHHHDDDDDDDANNGPRASLDALFAKAGMQLGDWKTITLKSPQRSDGPAIFTIEEPGAGHRSQLTLNRKDAQIIKWEPYSKQNSGRRLRTFVRYLHTGEAFGFFGQVIAFLAAGGVLVLIWTGFAMAYRRFSKTQGRD